MGIKITDYSKVYLFLTLTGISLILLLVGTCIDGWWEQRGALTVDVTTGTANCTMVRNSYTLWERVHCKTVGGDYICLLDASDNTGKYNNLLVIIKVIGSARKDQLPNERLVHLSGWSSAGNTNASFLFVCKNYKILILSLYDPFFINRIFFVGRWLFISAI